MDGQVTERCGDVEASLEAAELRELLDHATEHGETGGDRPARHDEAGAKPAERVVATDTLVTNEPSAGSTSERSWLENALPT